jgi:hypothetical protein|uniref:Uncharacterized protein n=1 Tax=viral metagenome TaxID=1070528 RepID=A0A6C0JVA8_9ZZZZ
MSAAIALNMEDLGKLVRHWVHFDTLISNFNKQIQAARKERDAYENTILVKLRQANYEKAIIQIDGGRLTVNEEKHHQALTFKSLEELLHLYYRANTGRKDETAEIIKFIRENRTFEITKALKKTAK